ncbi:hypothetical protein BU24DRAFT_400644 [Aaosphaeria arxii CBS 175.79]|uniref:Ribosome biogenesis protein Urb1 n=1 Tax=Aaosphaeria arxii CBS 175.79 TaxID=1450172 RepID=A0A6A5XB79_9PLEO|nr:uncharacterized protein BU24DRAFT_400644 [Aaosphaeria arxii CBS 175.79]KAF2010024.1 hypothetical protein BU24DRAFT_400644 [Aaosphaeria arxii CBS 175.79]
MGKRLAPEADSKPSYEAHHQKRQRVENSAERNSPRPAPQVEEITSAYQLQKALASNPSGYRNGLQTLKKFLDSILYTNDEESLPRKRAILREYLDTQKKEGREDKDTTFLPFIFQAWDYAVETDLESLQTQVPAVLALLLKVFSSHEDLQSYGTLLCKVTLRSTLIKRLNRSLSAPQSKEAIISPVLRLLTELTKFNEGAYARAVYAKRDFTLEYKTLGRNIGLWKDMKEDNEPAIRKPSIRVNAVRYLLAHLKYQDEIAKTEILSNSIIIRPLFDYLQFDHPSLIFEILDVMKTHVFQDKTIPRHTKNRILTGKVLSHIANLYRYKHAEGSLPEGHKAPDELGHDFLCLVCTSPAFGVMLPSPGFYPPANQDEDGDQVMDDAIDLPGELGLDQYDATHGKAQVRNVVLADFIRTLKPHSNKLQQDLMLAIFNACPELVANYFTHKEAFPYDPKLTSTWIGFSSFLYQTIELPVPSYLGGKRGYREYAPAISTVIQSILPQPLTQQVLTTCLNMKSDLVNFFAVRVMTVAFYKLRAVLREFSQASQMKTSKTWVQSQSRLVTEFSQRCPLMRTVILAFKRPNFQKGMMREAITRLLRLYYEVTPQVALQEKFDISVSLCNALLQAEQPSETPEDKAFRVMELEHWIQMARQSSTIRWWSKDKSLQHSPFITLLNLVAKSSENELYTGIKSLLVAILQDHEMLQMNTHPDALDALIASLGATYGSSGSSAQILDFLDNSFAMFVKKPIKYFDDLDAMKARLTDPPLPAGHFSPLLMTLVEQWPFKGGKPEKGNPAEPLAQWLSKLLYLLKLIGEDEALLVAVRDALVASADKAYQEVLKDSFQWKLGKEQAKQALKLATGVDFSGSERSSTSPIPIEKKKAKPEPLQEINLELPPEEDEKHAGLNRWRKKDIDEAVEDGDIGELLLCLCSKHTEIRIQAVSSIRQLIAHITASNDADFLQLRILLGAAVETAQSVISSEPFPYIGGVFAARAVRVIADPTHFMFGKINNFLLKGPNWTVANLPRYFGRVTINSEPDVDGSYHTEVDWYLDYLIDALRTEQDMEILRTKNVFERLLSYYLSASCAVSAKEKIVRLLLRAVSVGGSTTLIKRCGVVSWIQMRLQNNDHRQRSLKILATRIWENCDQEQVEQWSSKTLQPALALMVKAN